MLQKLKKFDLFLLADYNKDYDIMILIILYHLFGKFRTFSDSI